MDLNDLQEIAEKERQAQKGVCIRCCVAAGCLSSNSPAIKDGLEQAVKDAGLSDRVEVRGVHSWIITDLNQPWGDSDTCTSCGKCVLACPTGALFRQGASVAEMQRDRTKLEFIVTAREKKQWII